MSQQKLATFNMETRFDGLIKLLAEGLYPVPDIFVRELIQNAHDSIVRRRDVEPNLAGRIDVEVDPTQQTITFTDNGIGMDEADIRQFLSVIGSTGTGTVREKGGALSYELIGQFGIGMLSAFVVADKVYVDTRKLGADQSFQWRNSGSEECQLYSSDWNAVGSRVTVFLRSDFSYFLEEAKLREIIIRYCDFIPFPIHLNGRGPVNTVNAPWSRSYPSSEAEQDAYSDFINRRFSDYSLDVFPIQIRGKYQANGILYISDRHVAGINTDGQLDIFIRGMMVKQTDTALLPSWAKFIRGIIDSPDLKPTAARDNIQSSAPSFDYIQEKLGEVIVKRLTYLAEKQPKRFQTINEWHHYHLKGMAYFHDSFFRAVGDLLLFDTNKGQMSLRDYLPKHKPLPNGKAPIYFFAYYDSAAQYYRMADAKGLTVINAGDRFDEEVLNKYAEEYSSRVELVQFDNLSEGVLFEALAPEELKQYEEIEQQFVYILNRRGLNVRVETKRFFPADIPAVMVETARTKAEENLKALLSNPRIRMSMEDTWNEVIQTQRRKGRLLALNAGNPLIDGLAEVQDGRLREETMLAIYNNAMMYAHRMDEESMTIVHGSMVGMMKNTIDQYRKRQELQRQLEEARKQAMDSRTDWNRPEHIRVFMITPYDKAFQNVEQAVRNVLEGAPYFFEVRLARDYTHSGGELVDDLKKHIGESHAFLADVTGLNPNVMMEVGAIRLTGDNRPLLILKTSAQSLDKVADLGDKLWISYGDNTDRVAEIETVIRDNMQRREDMERLLRQRTKRFLAPSLLRTLPIRLTEEQIKAIAKKYATVEAFLEAKPEEVERISRLDKYLVMGMQSELGRLSENG